MGFIITILYFAFLVFLIGAGWKIFIKAGEPGWVCLIPVYGFYVMCKFCGVKNWWLIFIPFANIYIAIVAMIALARSFGKDTGFGIGLIFLGFIFYPILGYGDAVYVGPNGVPNSKDSLLNSLGVNQ
jgi:hypothetical protein